MCFLNVLVIFLMREYQDGKYTVDGVSDQIARIRTSVVARLPPLLRNKMTPLHVLVNKKEFLMKKSKG